MSTKTSFKRVSAVAALALAIGGFTAVSANAAAGSVSSITVSKKSIDKKAVLSAGTIAYTNTTTAVVGTGTAFAAADVGQSLWTAIDGFVGTVAAVTNGTHLTLAAIPAAAAGTGTNFYEGNLASTTVSSGIVTGTISGMTVTAGATGALMVNLAAGVAGTTEAARITIGGTTISSATATATTTDTVAPVIFTAPIAAGTYTATVTVSNDGAFAGTGPDVSTSFTLTVSAAASLSASSAIVLQAPSSTAGDGQGSVVATNYTTTLDAAPYSARATAGTTISTVQVLLLNNDQTAAGQKNTITATISGSGFVRVDQTSTVGAAATLRSDTFTNTGTNNVMWVHLSTDGTTGPGTVTISVTDAVTGATTTIGTKSFTSTGAVSKIAVSSSNFTIGAPGQTTGQNIARALATSTNDALNTATTATTPAFVVKATDSAGNATNITTITGVPSIVSSDLSVISGGVCVKDATTATNAALVGQGGTVGFYNCSFSTAANAASGSKATLTIKTADPADATGATFLTTTYAVSVGSTTVAKEAISTDAASYTPGAPMVVTVKATDSKGNPVADGTASPALTANKALGVTATALAAGFYNAGANANATSVAKSTLFAPSLAGPFIITGTGTDAATTALKASATVTDGSTTSAQIASLITKINALAALIAKIQKKLGIK